MCLSFSSFLRAAVISAILVPPFLLISSFTFLIGGPVDRLVCDNLISLELFTEVKIDCFILQFTLFGSHGITTITSSIFIHEMMLLLRDFWFLEYCFLSIFSFYINYSMFIFYHHHNKIQPRR